MMKEIGWNKHSIVNSQETSNGSFTLIGIQSGHVCYFSQLLNHLSERTSASLTGYIENEIYLTVECRLNRTTGSKFFSDCSITYDDQKSTFT